MKKLIFFAMLVLGIITFSSCGPTRYTVVDQPVAPVYERPVAPNPNYVWVDGDWFYRGGRYTYRNGYWARPRAHRVYTTGVWVKSGRGYYWKRGYWR